MLLLPSLPLPSVLAPMGMSAQGLGVGMLARVRFSFPGAFPHTPHRAESGWRRTGVRDGSLAENVAFVAFLVLTLPRVLFRLYIP